MKFISPLVIAFLVSINTELIAQDTFSICAFDPETGEVGSAGATCIESAAFSAIIISDVHPGVGVVHTQSYWLQANQDYGSDLIETDISAQQVIDSLVQYDAEGNAEIRQYGVVKMNSFVPSAGYSGVDCFDYKNHITGPNYAIQGNILLGQQVLDSMETRFLNAEGDLACKLMAAMQGAKMPGADTRCSDEGISSFSAFIRVAQMDDDSNDLSLDITVNTFPDLIEPIDTLQSLFEAAGGCVITSLENKSELAPQLFEMSGNRVKIIWARPIQQIEVMNASGQLIHSLDVENQNSTEMDLSTLSGGLVLLKIHSATTQHVVRWMKQ